MFSSHLNTILGTEFGLCPPAITSLFIRFKWTKQPNYDQCDLPRIMHLLTQLCSHLNPSFFRKIAKPELIYLVAFNLTKTIDASQRPCEEWSRCLPGHFAAGVSPRLPGHTRGDHQRARAQVILLRLFAYSELELPWDDTYDGCGAFAAPAAAVRSWPMTACAVSGHRTSARS
jgi:hypothetical protein